LNQCIQRLEQSGLGGLRWKCSIDDLPAQHGPEKEKLLLQSCRISRSDRVKARLGRTSFYVVAHLIIGAVEERLFQQYRWNADVSFQQAKFGRGLI
jgi:hypothetical protein